MLLLLLLQQQRVLLLLRGLVLHWLGFASEETLEEETKRDTSKEKETPLGCTGT